MKILYVITGLAQGGAERVVCDLADKMYEKGHDVRIVYLTGEVLTRPSHTNIQLIKINLNSLISLPSAYLNLSKVIKNFSPDVIHSHMVHANIFTRLVRISTPIRKLICTAHNSNEGGQARMLAYRFTHKLADLTTNVSKEASEAFITKKAVYKEEIVTIYNGINLNKFYYKSEARKKILDELGLNEDIYLILAVGRFNEQKDYPNLLNALKILKNKGLKKFKLLIAGDGELRAQIESLISELDLINDVILLGRRVDIPELMSAIDLFVLSSKYEGLPTVLIEALACQAHVISTDVSGANEIINKNIGEIVEKKNSQLLAQAIYEKNLKNIGKNYSASIFIKNKFDLENISEKWILIYNEK